MRKYVMDRAQFSLCTKCGVNPVEPARRKCRKCLNQEAKKRRDRRTQSGLCAKCGINLAEPARRCCRECLDRKTQETKDRRKSRQHAGLCVGCGTRPARPGYKTCQTCGDLANSRSKMHYIKRNEQGLCHCGAKAIGSSTMCSKCRAKQAQYSKRMKNERKLEGRCVSCGAKDAEQGKTYCPECLAEHREQQKARSARLREQGLCTRCGAPKLAGQSCTRCRNEKEGRLYKGNRKKALERDEHKCQICGRGKYLLVHHIDNHGDSKPIPNHDLDNLVTLCKICHRQITNLSQPGCNRALVVKLITAHG